MAGVNKVILIGNLGADPEVRFTNGGAPVANLRLATSESYTSKSGEKVDRTEWHRVVLFGRTAEIAKQYLTKGRQVYIEGRLQTRQWQDQSGQKRFSTEIVATQMTLLGGRGGAGGGGGYNGGGGGAMDEGFEAPPDMVEVGGGFPADDDIPF